MRPPASNRSPSAATEGNQVLSKSASLPKQPFDVTDRQTNDSASAAPAWKQEVNQRLAAHRNRRGGQEAPNDRAEESPRASGRAAEAAARVAARYAKAPSYSQLLAGEARAVVRAAGVAAEAARHAQAAAQAVLAGLESAEMESVGRGTVANPAPPATPARWQDEPPAAPSAHESVQDGPWIGAQPRWEETLPVPAPASRDVWSEMRVHPAREYRRGRDHGSDEGELFPEESFDPFDSYDAMASATVEPVQHLPANLIEFPRELVATRKARPRLAEGPLYDAAHEDPQLSIFEVDPGQLAAPVYPGEAAAETVAPPEWASIELDHHPEPEYAEDHPVYAAAPVAAVSHAMAGSTAEATPAQAAFAEGITSKESVAPERSAARSSYTQPAKSQAVELLVAPVSDRLLASVVDGALVTLAFLAAAVVVIASTAHPPTGRIALIASGCGWLLFSLLYQALFLSYAEEGTLGMRYARIALCTFEDDNPTPEQMRMRIPAMLLSVLPAGLGLLWALWDGDRLGWHDRLTKTYQRKY